MDVIDSIDTVVIGAGHAGLAMSAYLNAGGRSHVVLDRGRTGERWRSERWDSLRLLTPNWLTRLPGYQYDGPDPDGYQTAGELAALLERYARAFDLPVLEGVTVGAVAPTDGGFRVDTDYGTWLATNVVVATGHCDVPRVPAAAQGLGDDVVQLTPSSYKNPGQLALGGVLVVGASASGVQIADELVRSGRDVVVAVGSHTRLPRTYRGMDVLWWLDALGSLDRSVDDVPADRVRVEPSLQLVGRPDGANLDLGTLAAAGARIAGRLRAVSGDVVHLEQDLTMTTAIADGRLLRVLDRIDQHAEAAGLTGEVGAPDRPPPVTLPEGPPRIDLRESGIATVVWATGYRRDHDWLHVPGVADGELGQRYGVTSVPGLFTVGQRFQTRRSSSFIGGSRHDAALVAAHLDALRPVRRSATVHLRNRS